MSRGKYLAREGPGSRLPSSDIPHDILLARAGIPTLLSQWPRSNLLLQPHGVSYLLTFKPPSPRGLCPVHLMRWPNAIHVSAYHAHGKTPNGSLHSPLLFPCGTLFQQNYRDQRTLIPCSFSLRLTPSDPWPVVACCNCSIPGCVCSNRQLAKLLSGNEVRGKVAIAAMQKAVNFTRSLSTWSRKVS